LIKQFNHLTIQLPQGRGFSPQGGGTFNQISWQGDDDSGKKLPAGVYFCQLKADELNITKKIVKLR